MAIKDYRAPAVITRRNQRSTDDTYKSQLPTDTVQVSIQTSENFCTLVFHMNNKK